MPEPDRPDDRESIADAASLFGTDEIRPIRVPPPASPPPAAASGGYDLDAPTTPDDDLAPPAPVLLPTPSERPRARSRPKPQPAPVEDPGAIGDTSEFEHEVSTVEPVWTRGAEWGPDLIRVGSAGLGTLFLAWLCWGYVLPVLLVLALGGAATVLLTYPLLITLERPVRITPEQAVTDFFAAASHRFPHYRRMWLLLSSAGRESGPFRSFEDFRDHWKARSEGWKRSRNAGRLSALEFEVKDFQADKSTGKENSKADYTVRIVVRDQAEDGPIASFRMSHGLVKGPDRMWYLDRGTLPSSPA